MSRDLGQPERPDAADVLRQGPSDIIDEAPPPELWDGIAGELRLDDSGASTAPSAADGGGGEGGPSVVPLGDRRRKRSERIAVAVGIVAAVLLVAVPLWLAYRASLDLPDSEADLVALSEGDPATGRAELDGRDLTVDTSGLAAPDGSVHELWLLDLTDDGELADLVSLGIIRDRGGTFEVDPEVDLERFDVVDISLEPLDNDPAHSGNSILQGELG